jgi:hypothetical protein
MNWFPDWLTDDKALLSLVSIGLGWLLAQGTTLVKDWLNIRRLKNGLLIELEDIRAQLERMQLQNKRNLHFYALNGVPNEGSLPIHNLFFRQHFKDVFGKLNHVQRLSYQLIHSFLDALNQQQAGMTAFLEKNYETRSSPTDSAEASRVLQEFGDRVIAIHRGTMKTLWHITFHLRNRENPALDYKGSVHESYLRFLEEVEDDIRKTIEDGSSLKREDLEKIYDEKFFRSES